MSEIAEHNEPIREKFEVDNDMKAEWCLSKIRRIRVDQQCEKDELQRQMKFYIDQMEEIDRKADADVAFFESILNEYFANRMQEGFTKTSKTQTVYKLPSGKLVLKKQNPDFDYKTNQQQIVSWLKANKKTEFVKTKEEVNWQELKKTITVVGDGVATKDGEMIPGVKVTEREDVFEVEVN